MIAEPSDDQRRECAIAAARIFQVGGSVLWSLEASGLRWELSCWADFCGRCGFMGALHGSS